MTATYTTAHSQAPAAVGVARVRPAFGCMAVASWSFVPANLGHDAKTIGPRRLPVTSP